MKKILLTGAAGFVGSHVLEHLLVNTDWDVHAIVSFRHQGTSERLAQVLATNPSWPKRVTIHTHDLTAPLSRVLRNQLGRIHYIVNVASESHVDRSIQMPGRFIQNNVALMTNILEYATTAGGIEKFIQISTDEVYGPAPNDHRHKEWETYLPSNPYSASKAAQESIAFAYWRTYGVPLVITNTMNIFGERQDPEKFVPMVMRRILLGEKVNIHASNDGKQVGSRFYLHARNQADALLYILENAPVAKYGEQDRPLKVNIVGEREVDNLQMAEMISHFMGMPLRYELVDFHSSRPGHDLRYALDGTKLAAAGWKQPLNLEESLRKTVDWTMSHREWLA